MTRIDYNRAIADQKAWMRQCGGDLVGYVARYGSKADPEHSGEGGEAIFEADSAELRKLEELAELHRIDPRNRAVRSHDPALGYTLAYRGHTIVIKQDFGGGLHLIDGMPCRWGYVVTKNRCNAMPGATWVPDRARCQSRHRHSD